MTTPVSSNVQGTVGIPQPVASGNPQPNFLDRIATFPCQVVGPFLTVDDIQVLKIIRKNQRSDRKLVYETVKGAYVRRQKAIQFFADMIKLIKEYLEDAKDLQKLKDQLEKEWGENSFYQNPDAIILQSKEITAKALSENSSTESLDSLSINEVSDVAIRLFQAMDKFFKELPPEQNGQPPVHQDNFAVTMAHHFIKYSSSLRNIAGQTGVAEDTFKRKMNGFIINLFRRVINNHEKIQFKVNQGENVVLVHLTALDLLNLRRNVEPFISDSDGDLMDTFKKLMDVLKSGDKEDYEVNVRFLEGNQVPKDRFALKWLQVIIEYYLKNNNLVACYELLKIAARKNIQIFPCEAAFKAIVSSQEAAIEARIKALGEGKTDVLLKLNIYKAQIEHDILQGKITFGQGLQFLKNLDIDYCMKEHPNDFYAFLDAIIKIPCGNVDEQLKFIDEIPHRVLVNIFHYKLINHKIEIAQKAQEDGQQSDKHALEIEKILLTRKFAVQDIQGVFESVKLIFGSGKKFVSLISQFIENSPNDLKARAIIELVKNPMALGGAFKYLLQFFLEIKKTKKICREFAQVLSSYIFLNRDFFLKWAAENIKVDGLINLKDEENLFIMQCCIENLIGRAAREHAQYEDMPELQKTNTHKYIHCAVKVLKILTDSYPTKLSKVNDDILKCFLTMLNYINSIEENHTFESVTYEIQYLEKMYKEHFSKNDELRAYYHVCMMDKFIRAASEAAASEAVRDLIKLENVFQHDLVKEKLVNLFKFLDHEPKQKLFNELLQIASKNPETTNLLYFCLIYAYDQSYLNAQEKYVRIQECFIAYFKIKNVVLNQDMHNLLVIYIKNLSDENKINFYNQLKEAAAQREDLQKVLHGCFPK